MPNTEVVQDPPDKDYVILLVEPGKDRVEAFDIKGGSSETAVRIANHLLGCLTSRCLICSPNRVSFFPSSSAYDDIVTETSRWLES